MKDINDIEGWYKDELNNYSVEPDNSVWQSLSDELEAAAPLTDETISEWYKKEVVKLEERPDYTVWEKLSLKLDTTSVWDKLVVSLNKYDQFIWWRNLTFKGIAVFLLLFGSYWAYDNYQFNTTNNSLAKNITQLKTTSSANKNSIEKSVDGKQNKTDYSYSSTQKIVVPYQIKAVINEAKTTFINKNTTSKSNNLSASATDEIYYHQIRANDLSSLKTENEQTIFTELNNINLSDLEISRVFANGDFLVKKDKNKIVFNSKRFSSYFLYGLYARRIYVGFNVGIKKQGIITNFKNSAELASYRQTNFLDFGHVIGTTVGYIVSDNFNVETNININSTSGYKREYYSEGLSYVENLNLKYSSISVLAKKMNNKSTFDNKLYSTNFIAGIYVGYLRSAVSTVNNNSKKLDEYNNSDLGVVLGIEQDRYISKSFVISPSVRYNQGILNIAKDNSPFSSSRNFSLEFNFGVKYIFLKKGKY